MEGLMERIRVKSDQQKTLLDTAKSLRIAMADKRHSLDSQDKVPNQKINELFPRESFFAAPPPLSIINMRSV